MVNKRIVLSITQIHYNTNWFLVFHSSRTSSWLELRDCFAKRPRFRPVPLITTIYLELSKTN